MFPINTVNRFKRIMLISNMLLIGIILILFLNPNRGRYIRYFLADLLQSHEIDRSMGWFPHELGNYWINRDFIPCDLNNKAWFWEVVRTMKTDSADYFLIEKLLNPCDTAEHETYYQWYAYTPGDKLYMANDKFEYTDMEADFSLKEGESFIRQGLRYTLIERTENKMTFEYDLYENDTFHYVFEKGIGNEIGWEEVKIGQMVYFKNINRIWKKIEKL